jgi:hypothetical protein
VSSSSAKASLIQAKDVKPPQETCGTFNTQQNTHLIASFGVYGLFAIAVSGAGTSVNPPAFSICSSNTCPVDTSLYTD